MQDYLINWNAGPLGVVLRPDLGLDMPPVVAQLLPQQSVLRMSGVRVGDMLISVNGKKTAKLGYDKVVKLLFKERLPIVLHFRVPSGGSISGPGTAVDVEASNVSHASEPDYYPQYQNQVLPMPPAPAPATPALPSERFTDASARSRPRSGSSVLGVPADFADAPPLVRVQSQPHQQRPERSQQPPNLMQMVRGRRSQSTESVPRSRKPSSAASAPRERTSPHPADDRPRHTRKTHKNRAEAEERRLRKQYSVVWERGSLGISFRAFNAKVDVPTVDFISASRGQGRGMERVCVNDVLIAVNGEKTKLLGVEKVLRWLHVIEKPVVLRFHSSSNRIPSNPVPQISNAPTLPPAPLGMDAPSQPHPPTRRNTTASAGGDGPRRRRDSTENQIRNRFEQQHFEDDSYYDSGDNSSYNDDEFEQLYSQPDPPQRSGRRHSTDQRDGPRLPRRTRDDSMHAYIARAHENRASLGPQNLNAQSQLSDDSVDAVGDFRREQQQPPGLHEFDLRIDAHVVPRESSRRDKDEDDRRVRMADTGRGRGDSIDSAASTPAPARRRSHSSAQSNPRQNHHVAFTDAPLTTEDIPPPPASPSNYSSGMHVGWNMNRSPYPHPHPQQSPSTPSTLQRKASLSASELTLRAAVEVVARASGRPADQCEFAGVPLVRIQDGSVQAKLLVVYARTCLAKEQAAKAAVVTPMLAPATAVMNDAVTTTVQLPPVAGNPLGRKGSHRQFLSYTITTDDETASRQRPPPEQQQRMETASNHSGSSRSSARRHVPQYAAAGVYEQLNGVPPPPVPIPVTGRTDRSASGDFIALQDFELQEDGSLTERRTASSVHSSSTAGTGSKVADEASADSHQVTSAGPLANGVSTDVRSEQSASTPEWVASSIGSSTAEVLSTTDSSAHPDVTTFDDLIALPTGRQTPVERADEHLDDDEDDVDVEQEHEVEEEKQQQQQPSALADPRVAALFSSVPDVHGQLAGKRPSAVLTKKGMIDEIQEILDSLQMESQFERHSHMGMGTMPSPPTSGPLVAAAHAPTVRSCCQCGKRSDDLAEMALGAHGEREWYCQDCWEFFFYSEEHEQEPSPSLSGERGSELDADAGSVDDEEAFKYSFHDSAFGRDDVMMMRLARPSPSRSPFSPGSSPRDSALTNASSVTEHGDEVWL